ncbi:hypothetical protein GF374_00825 [Candidatus Woesearchaeota archaeon]|nr:hypothetical protein [Candidatus Woesearchaeota archaeon]
MKNKKFNIKAELELTTWLLGVVNSEEEYNYLLEEKARLSSLVSVLHSIHNKFIERRYC